MRRVPLAIVLVLSLSLFSVGKAGSSPGISERPFQAGERLTYDISWLSISAGKAIMEVARDEGTSGRPMVHLVTTAQSNPMITKFYPVDNRVESQIDLATFLPEHMTFRRREGKRKNDFDYTFHHKEGTVTAVKDGTSDILPIPPDTQDAISCLYFVRRSMSLKPGESLTMNVHHDKKNYKLEVRVEAIEMLEGGWGKVETARVLVIMPFQGIFLNQGNVRVWFTTDERRIPVRMKAKVIIGSVVAELISGFPGKPAPA